MAFEVRRRKAAAEERRRERMSLAETPAEQLNAAFDYLRAALRAAKPETADRLRTEVAGQLVDIADRTRQTK